MFKLKNKVSLCPLPFPSKNITSDANLIFKFSSFLCFLSIFIERLFNFLHDDQPMQPLTPCTNSPYLMVNFGQENFLYEPANEFDQRIYMAALLHDYCEQTNGS